MLQPGRADTYRDYDLLVSSVREMQPTANSVGEEGYLEQPEVHNCFKLFEIIAECSVSFVKRIKMSQKV